MRDNNRKCLFWVSYCVIILHAFYMICNTKRITSLEDRVNEKKGRHQQHIKNVFTSAVDLVFVFRLEIFLLLRLNKACLRQPLCSFCCQCYADIVSPRETRYALLKTSWEFPPPFDTFMRSEYVVHLISDSSDEYFSLCRCLLNLFLLVGLVHHHPWFRRVSCAFRRRR